MGNQLGQMLSSEVGVPSIDFSTITDYVVLIVYLLRKMMVSKTECYQLIRNYSSGSVEKVGVEPDPKRAGPASWNLEHA